MLYIFKMYITKFIFSGVHFFILPNIYIELLKWTLISVLIFRCSIIGSIVEERIVPIL